MGLVSWDEPGSPVTRLPGGSSNQVLRGTDKAATGASHRCRAWRGPGGSLDPGFLTVVTEMGMVTTTAPQASAGIACAKPFVCHSSVTCPGSPFNRRGRRGSERQSHLPEFPQQGWDLYPGPADSGVQAFAGR